MPSLEIELLHQTDTIIEFKWTHTGDMCKVQRDGETIYTGLRNSFQDSGLESGELYTYTIERLNASGKPTEHIKMRTSTEYLSEECKNPLERAAVTAIVSASKIALAWSAIEELQEFDIYRDNQFVGTTKKNQFTDYSFSKGAKHIYKVNAKRPLEQSETILSKGKSLAAHLFGMSHWKSSKEEAAMEKFDLTIEIATADYRISGPPIMDAENQSVKWHFRYSTFLPDDYLVNPNLLSFNRYFLGDDRGFDVDATDFRSQVNFSVDLHTSEAGVEFKRDVGISIAYDWRKKFRKADVASADKVYMEKVEEDDRNVAVQLHHCVGNPLTPSPNIDYVVTARFYRDGHYDLVGVHDQAPNHEVYLRQSREKDWTKIHQTESKGLAWMSETIASHYWRIFNFH